MGFYPAMKVPFVCICPGLVKLISNSTFAHEDVNRLHGHVKVSMVRAGSLRNHYLPRMHMVCQHLGVSKHQPTLVSLMDMSAHADCLG